MSVLAKKDSRNDKPGDKPSIPIYNKRRTESDIKLSVKNSLTKTNMVSADNKKDASDPQNSSRAFPVDGKMILREGFSSSGDDDEISIFKESLNKQKIPPKSGFNSNTKHNFRSKSQMEEKPKMDLNNEFIHKTSINVGLLNKTQITENKEKNEMTQTVVTTKYEDKKPGDINKLMKNKGQIDVDCTLVVINDSQTVYEGNLRKKTSITRLINTYMEGEEEYFEGTLIRGLKTGFCRVLYSSNVYKEGYFINGTLEGEGCLKYPNGISINGLFVNNQLRSNIILSIDNATYSIDYVQGEYHNDKLFMSDKNVLLVTTNPCDNINEYVGKIKVYFRNGYKLEVLFEKGMISNNVECNLYDKSESLIRGKIKHGVNVEKNSMYIFSPNQDPDNEYLVHLKGEGTVVRKHKR